MANLKITLGYNGKTAAFRMLPKYAEDPAKYQTKLDQYAHAFASNIAKQTAVGEEEILNNIKVISSEPCEPIEFIVFTNETDGREERVANLLPSALDDYSRIERAKQMLENKFGGGWNFVRFEA